MDSTKSSSQCSSGHTWKAGTTPAAFTTTHWSVVLIAGEGDSQQKSLALEELCRKYWYPLYSYVRRRGNSAEDAQDLTQGFFARLLERESICLADRNRGKFRTFLLTALKNFLIQQHEKSRAVKRGGGQVPWAIDADQAEERFAAELVDPITPEKLYEKQWATTLLEQAHLALQKEYLKAGNQRLFGHLKDNLWGNRGKSFASIASELGMNEGAVKVAAHRLRKRFGEQLQLEIANTVATPEEVEEELRALMAAVA